MSKYLKIISVRLMKCLGRSGAFSKITIPSTSQVAKAFLADNVPEIVDWPSCSPDLNPIENLWAIVKHNVEKRMPKNLDDLEKFLTKEWNSIPKSGLNNLVNSMRRRCELVIEGNGERINF